uniref:Beta-sarcoglycan n=1 Tax=Romanomermis culicivorax TaxID=13658 RepID=A0A915HJ35_ROMCU
MRDDGLQCDMFMKLVYASLPCPLLLCDYLLSSRLKLKIVKKQKVIGFEIYATAFQYSAVLCWQFQPKQLFLAAVLKILAEKKKLSRKKSSSDDLSSSGHLSVQDKEVYEKKLQETGLRGGKLAFVLTCLSVLWIVSIATFTCNVMMLVVLRMNHRGMDTIQFYKTTPNGQPVVRFTAKNVHFEAVAPQSGLISNSGNTKFEVKGSKIELIDGYSASNNHETEQKSSSIILEDKILKMNGVNDFYIADSRTSNAMFQATKPVLKFEKPLEHIWSEVIRTKKVRAPIDEHLSIEGRKIIFNGNEGNYFSGRHVFLRALNNITLKTSDKGSMTFDAVQGVRLAVAGKMKVSKSPDFEADEMGRRLCACTENGRLFTVLGNEPCSINPAYC